VQKLKEFKVPFFSQHHIIIITITVIIIIMIIIVGVIMPKYHDARTEEAQLTVSYTQGGWWNATIVARYIHVKARCRTPAVNYGRTHGQEAKLLPIYRHISTGVSMCDSQS